MNSTTPRTRAALTIAAIAILMIMASMLLHQPATPHSPPKRVTSTARPTKPTSPASSPSAVNSFAPAPKPEHQADARTRSYASKTAPSPLINSPAAPDSDLSAAVAMAMAHAKDDIVVQFLVVPTIQITPPRPADWNHDGKVGAEDLWSFLNDWFAGRGDINKDGKNNTSDILAFYNAWLDGAQ